VFAREIHQEIQVACGRLIKFVAEARNANATNGYNNAELHAANSGRSLMQIYY